LKFNRLNDIVDKARKQIRFACTCKKIRYYEIREGIKMIVHIQKPEMTKHYLFSDEFTKVRINADIL